MPQSPGGNRAIWIAACLAVVLALAMFVWRGPIRGSNFRANADAIFILTPAEVWLRGGNPYSRDDVSRAWLAAGEAAELDPSQRGGGVYPPGAFPVLAPFAPWSPSVRASVWMAASIALYFATLVLLVRVAGLSLRHPSAWFMIALGLALSAAHTCLVLGQSAILISLLVVAAAAARRSQREWLAGCLLGLAAATKPQLAALFIAYELLRGRWRVVLAAFIAAAIITLVGVLRMHLAGLAWWPMWQSNLGEFTAGGEGDPVKAGWWAFLFIHLESPLVVMGLERDPAMYTALGVVALLALVYGVIDHRCRCHGSFEDRSELISLSFVAVITLLFAYHRYYDATLLLFPLALMFRLVQRGARSKAIITGLILAPLWVPGPAALGAAEQHAFIPHWLATSMLWRGWILPHHTWGLVVLAIWLSWLRWSRRATTA